jgi:hypothetical protein
MAFLWSLIGPLLNLITKLLPFLLIYKKGKTDNMNEIMRKGLDAQKRILENKGTTSRNRDELIKRLRDHGF